MELVVVVDAVVVVDIPFEAAGVVENVVVVAVAEFDDEHEGSSEHASHASAVLLSFTKQHLQQQLFVESI